MEIRAGIIRRPEFFPQRQIGDDLAEPGDLLYPALSSGGRIVSSSSFLESGLEESLVGFDPIGMQPVLCLPLTVESCYEGEFFRALVSVVNTSSYALRDVQVDIDAVTPSKTKQALGRQSLSVFEAKSAFTRVVELPLRELGKYTIAVRSHGVDPGDNSRDTSWSSVVAVLKGVQEEFVPIAYRIPVPYFELAHIFEPDRRLILALTISLTNCTSSFLSLTTCHLDLHPRSPYTVVTAPIMDAGLTAVRGNFFRPSPLHELSLPPSEKQSFTFYLALPQAMLRRAPVKTFAGNQRWGVITSTIGDVGSLHWEWRRHKGDGGTGECTRIWLKDFVAPPRIEIRLQSKRLTASPCGLGAGCAQAGQPIQVEGCVVRHTMPASGAADAKMTEYVKGEWAVKVRPEKLAPDWLYGGPTWIPLDHVLDIAEAQCRMHRFTLTLVPWRAGELTIPACALEVVSVENERVLAPEPPAWVQEPSTFPLSAGAQGKCTMVSVETPHANEPLAFISVV